MMRAIQQALGIESDDVANYVFPKTWPSDREQRDLGGLIAIVGINRLFEKVGRLGHRVDLHLAEFQ